MKSNANVIMMIRKDGNAHEVKYEVMRKTKEMKNIVNGKQR